METLEAFLETVKEVRLIKVRNYHEVLQIVIGSIMSGVAWFYLYTREVGLITKIVWAAILAIMAFIALMTVYIAIKVLILEEMPNMHKIYGVVFAAGTLILVRAKRGIPSSAKAFRLSDVTINKPRGFEKFVCGSKSAVVYVKLIVEGSKLLSKWVISLDDAETVANIVNEW